MGEKQDPVEQTIEKLKPLLSELSFGSVVGYCSGYAMKKVGKAMAFVIGVGFIGVQTVVHFGYIDVNWTKVRDDAIKPLDTVRCFLFLGNCFWIPLLGLNWTEWC